jgi:hypothetical protein
MEHFSGYLDNLMATTQSRWSEQSFAAAHVAVQKQQPKITILPPGPHRPELETKQHIFKGSRMPMSTTFVADGETESTGIDYSDYGRMSTMVQKLDKGRRNERPAWAVNDVQLMKVLCQYMESRANIDGGWQRMKQPGTVAQRIKRAQNKIISRLPDKIEILDGLCKEYVELKKNPAATCDRLQELEIEIEGLDTYIRTSQKDGGLLLAVGCVQTYWKECLDSVACAERLHIKPPHVRQIIWRLDKACKKVSREVRVTMQINLLRGLRSNPVAVAAKGQRQCWVCGVIFTPTGNRVIVTCNKRKCRKQEEEKQKRAKETEARKFYCGTACKDTARFAVKSLPVPVKPGVGLFVPIAGGDRYQNYLKFCLVVGTPPLTEQQWSMGCGPGSYDKGIRNAPQK